MVDRPSKKQPNPVPERHFDFEAFISTCLFDKKLGDIVASNPPGQKGLDPAVAKKAKERLKEIAKDFVVGENNSAWVNARIDSLGSEMFENWKDIAEHFNRAPHVAQ